MCTDLPTDAEAYILEANTPKKYNIVNTANCYERTNYAKACQELVKYAKMDKEIHLVWDWKLYPPDSGKVITKELQLQELKTETKANKNKAK